MRLLVMKCCDTYENCEAVMHHKETIHLHYYFFTLHFTKIQFCASSINKCFYKVKIHHSC
ncbi:hypothetical protein WDU94_008233, partial [Cyamophila willieti]